MNNTPPDGSTRQRALDPTLSCIVQAPAGSGKTELLTKRFLVLLTRVEKPEAILALTFTNKAAQEMRHRILQALENAATTEISSVQTTELHQLAQAVLHRDQRKNWGLLNNTHRLRIQTIDAFCHTLASQLPITSQMGAMPSITEQPETYYRAAAKQLLHLFFSTTEPRWKQALEIVLPYLDNDFQKAEDLLCALLPHRDQWLPHLFALEKETLVESLARVQQEHCFYLEKLCPLPIQKALLTGKSPYPLSSWQDLSTRLLTQKGEWRKRFPQAEKNIISALMPLIEADDKFRQALYHTQQIPPATYTASQWAFLSALVVLLPLLVAELLQQFKQAEVTDFTEIAQRALYALTQLESDPHIGVQLDEMIHHILIDEFQDTSHTQFRLLELLTQTWGQDHRTLFLVGDPMQSIYGFRAADVGLFFSAQKNGVGNISLESLFLSSNFRTVSNLVTWVNQTFCPVVDPFYPAIGLIDENLAENPVAVSFSSSRQVEAEKMAETILSLREKNPNETIAILVRSRRQLIELFPVLKRQALPFTAIDIFNLADHPAIQDVWSLTRALLSRADRIAWLALLRAPWCGLQLSDLHHLATDPATSLYTHLFNPMVIEQLSTDGQTRVAFIQPILQQAFQEQRRFTLSRWIKNTWERLQGPHYLTQTGEYEDVIRFFDLLDDVDEGGDIADYAAIETKLQQLFSSTQTNDLNPIQLMTIHKAKGLEFDTVFLPNLAQTAPPNKKALFQWMERLNQTGEYDLILAPIPAAQYSSDPIYEWVSHEKNQRAYDESIRLLYVALTRAKKRIFLSIAQKIKKNSFVSPIWTAVEKNTPLHEMTDFTSVENSEVRQPKLRRIAGIETIPQFVFSPEKNDFQNAHFVFNQSMKHFEEQCFGILLHRILKQIADEGIFHWPVQRIQKHHAQWQHYLTAQGLSPPVISSHLTQLMDALTALLQNEKAQWLLNNRHLDSQTEFKMTVCQKSHCRDMIIDRLFVDNGVQWIIDYKTTDRFLPAHRQQLIQYASALMPLSEHPICLGVFFPLTGAWHEWPFRETTEVAYES